MHNIKFQKPNLTALYRPWEFQLITLSRPWSACCVLPGPRGVVFCSLKGASPYCHPFLLFQRDDSSEKSERHFLLPVLISPTLLTINFLAK